MTAYVVRWDCLPAFREAFPAIELPAGTDALGIETVDGSATLLEAFCEDDTGCYDLKFSINEADAASLATFADKYGDTCVGA